MRRTARLLTALAVAGFVLGPAFAEARPGGRSSSGSRGSQTYSAPPSTQTAPGGAQQFQRTQTAPSQPATAATGAAARPAAAAQGGFLSRNPMMAGLMGGLLGAGLFGLLSGSGLFGGMAGFAGFLGLLLQVALIAGVVFLVMRLIRGARRPAVAAGPSPDAYAREMHPAGGRAQPGTGMGAGMAAAAVATRPVQIADGDYQAFERLLVEVNAAWSRQDLETLRRLSTSEMTNYFADDLAALRARGWTNTTADVRLEGGDLAEAWAENGQEYATVAMRFTLVDVTRAQDGTVTEGHPSERQTATEIWTFVRYPGEAWRLSAIQQTG